MSGRRLYRSHNKEKNRFTIIVKLFFSSGNVRVKFLVNSFTIPFWRAMISFKGVQFGWIVALKAAVGDRLKFSVDR